MGRCGLGLRVEGGDGGGFAPRSPRAVCGHPKSNSSTVAKAGAVEYSPPNEQD